MVAQYERFPGNKQGPLTPEVNRQLLSAESAGQPPTIEVSGLDRVYASLTRGAASPEPGYAPTIDVFDGMFVPNFINDSFIHIEGTSMYAVSERLLAENSTVHFHLATELELAKEQQERADHGYYGLERVQNIRAMLSEKGLPSSLEQSIVYMNTLVIPLGASLATRVSFGYDSREAEEAGIRRDIENDDTSSEEHGVSVLSDIRRMDEGLVNKSISLCLSHDNSSVAWGESLDPELKDENDFQRKVEQFRKCAEIAIATLYNEAGLAAPEKTMSWKPISQMQELFTSVNPDHIGASPSL